jgi:hypothetical protein
MDIVENTDFYQRLVTANKLIEAQDNIEFTYWANVLLSDTLLISTEMLSHITRVPEVDILYQWIRVDKGLYHGSRTFLLSRIPHLMKGIDAGVELFWYKDADDPTREYPVPKSELPQYLWFLITHMHRAEQEKYFSVGEINKMLPNKWRKECKQ